MSSIWHERAGEPWQARALLPGRALHGADLGLPGIRIFSLRQGGAALLVRPGVRVRVNGEAILGGMKRLEHRDEILVGPTRLFFSTETTPLVTRFRLGPDARPPICPVCRGPVRDGLQAVECPGCGRWFHQLEATDDRPAKPCWTYAPSCRFCNHPTSFEASAAWRPEQEESRV